MPENKTCGHPPNPPDDKDESGRLYVSCFQCFIEGLDSLEERMLYLSAGDHYHDATTKDGDNSTK